MIPLFQPTDVARNRVIAAGFLTLLLAAHPAECGWIRLPPLTHNQANLDLPVHLDETDRLTLRISSQFGPQMLVRMGREKSRVDFESSNASDKNSIARMVCRPFEKPTGVSPRRLLMKRRSRGWTFYLDDAPLVEMPEGFTGPLHLEIPEENLPDPNAPDVFIQRVSPYVFFDDFLVPEDAEYPLMQWEKRIGDWQLHSVTQQLAGTRGARGKKGRNPPGADRSPNFYSLSGYGTNAVIAAGMEFLDHYRVSAAVQHNSGTNGIVFLLRPENGKYHAVTLENHPNKPTLVLAMWRGQTGSPRREILAAAETELIPGQWFLLQASLFDDLVVCSINRSEILRERIALPPGGQFGLFANSSQGTRFDDISVQTHDDLSISTPRDISRHLDFSPDQVRIEEGTLDKSRGSHIRHQKNHVRVLQGTPARIVVGGPSSSPRNIEAVFQADRNPSGPHAVSLGTNGFHETHYSLTCIPEKNANRVRLLQNGKTVLDEFSVPSKKDSPRTTLRLEAQESGRLFGFLNGRLAVRAVAQSTPVGPAEVSAFPDTRLSLPVRSTPEFELKDHRENVHSFVIDPFMRHWASPEGQWVPAPDGLVWYRGDVFGAVEITLPLPANSELHMAVVEGDTNGACILRTDDGKNLHIKIHPDPNDENTAITNVIPLADIPLRELDKVGELPIVTLHQRDHCFWIRAGDKELFSTHLDASLPGSRMRIQGYSTEALRYVQVVRDNVLDVLFKTSLFDWTLNGGRWEIINRFHCDPRWSHMNGENADGLAALWSHFEFQGDFCAELFAGTRHGWYARVGDFNMTLLNNTNFAGSGYTVITTGWDPDESALYSRLLRHGRELSRSSEYAAPRYREGNVRKGREPLIAGGRDVHGAWYSIKLRRLGDLLMYSFDNIPLITVRDPQPLLSGGLGIWTYRTSMMVARVRVAAEKITPRAVAAHRIQPAILKESEPAGQQTFASADANHPLLAPLHPNYWHPEDDVGHPMIDWVKDSSDETIMRVRSRLGGGTFLAKADLPPLPTEKLAGYRFEISRRPRTAVNFAFSLGTSNNAAFDPVAEYSFVLSGTTQPDGPRRILGSGKIPASETDDFSNASGSSIFVPLPADAVSIASHARIDGFGNLQPSAIQQGLSANPPGSAYAVRGFVPVWMGIEHAADGLNLEERDRQRLAQENSRLAPGAIGSISVPMPEVSQARVAWQKQPGFDDITIAFAKTLPDTVVFSLPCEHPWRMPPDSLLKINGTALTLRPHGLEWKAEIPRPTPWPPGASLDVQLFTNTIPVLQAMLLPVDAPTNFPPILTRLHYPGHFNTFETYDSGPTKEFKGAATATIVRGMPPKGSILRLENRGGRSRLHGVIGQGIDLLANPLLTFGYRADKLARVSIEPISKLSLNFSEPSTGTDMAADPAVLDEQHHIYNARAVPDKGKFPLPLYQALSASTPRLRSRHRIDQTGLYSWLELDRLVCGPAIGPDRPLEFQAFFNDLDAVQKCEYRIVQDKGDLSAEAIPWIAFTNETVIAPDTSRLSNGRYALDLRASDTRGAVSEVVSVPFLYDETPPRLNIVMEDTPAASNGKRLALLAEKNANLSPLRFDSLSMHCEGRPVPVNPGRKTLALSPANARIAFNWPKKLAAFLDESADGDILQVEFDGVSDGAGNQAAPAQTSIRIDYASDTTPPTADSFRTLPNDNPHWMRLAIGNYAATAFFRGDRHTRYAHVSDSGDYGALEMTPAHPRSSPSVSFGKNPWKPSVHPWLAISLCATHAMVKEDQAAVTITLHAAGDETFTVNGKKNKRFELPLIAKPSSSLESRYSRCLIGTLDWTTNRWNDVIIDVRKLLNDGDGEPPPIKSLELGFARQKALRIRIRSLAIMAAWEEAHRLRFTAHDASGMGGIVWPTGETDTMEVSPARLPLPEDGKRWIRLRLRDKPGNTTPEIHLPVPPPPAEAAENEDELPETEGKNNP